MTIHGYELEWHAWPQAGALLIHKPTQIAVVSAIDTYRNRAIVRRRLSALVGSLDTGLSSQEWDVPIRLLEFEASRFGSTMVEPSLRQILEKCVAQREAAWAVERRES